MFFEQADPLSAAAIAAGLPTTCIRLPGCLANYGVNVEETFRTGGLQLARILQGAPTGSRSCLELLQQRFGLLQVRRVEAPREPTIDRGEKIVGFDALALITPKVSESGSGTQFPAPRTLLSSDLDRRLKVCLHRLDRSLGLQQEFGPYLM